MRFGDTLNRSNVMLSYGKVIRNSEGDYEGVILINASERTFFKVYSDIIVCAAFQRQRATGFACPEIAGYNCQWQQI